MKKSLLFLSLILVALTSAAQASFGYVSYDDILKQMPEYAVVQQDLKDLQTKYDAEMQRSEREFNQKYNEVIDGQAGFPQNILEKRHKELQELMERSMQFKEEIRKSMMQARHEMMEPLHNKLNEAIKNVCLQEGYDYIINADRNAYLFINPERGVDATEAVKTFLNL